MPEVIVSLKKDATDADLARAKKQVTDQGGKIKEEYTLIKGFSASLPEGTMSTLQADPKIDVEHDGEVKTQS